MDGEDDAGPGPVASRRSLRVALKNLRESRGVTQDEAARQLEWSMSKIVRIENGASKVSISDVQAMLRLYGRSDPATVSQMLDWARRARRRDWWLEYKDAFRGGHTNFIGLEAEATQLRAFEISLVPGLLQTRSYAEAVLRVMTPTDDIVRRRLDLRMRRQREVFGKAEPPSMTFVLDEAVIRRFAGGRLLMRDQLQHLIKATARTCVDLRLLPFTAGLHAGCDGAFALLDLGRGDWMAFASNARGGTFAEAPDDVSAYHLVFDHLLSTALAPDETVQFLRELVDTVYM